MILALEAWNTTAMQALSNILMSRCRLLGLILALFFSASVIQAQPLQRLMLTSTTYVQLDESRAVVELLNERSEVLYRFGGWGTAEDALSKPVHISTQSGLKILVTDAEKRQVAVLDNRLQRIASFDIAEFEPTAAFMVGSEQVLVLSTGFEQWLLIDSRSSIRMPVMSDIEAASNVSGVNPLFDAERLYLPYEASGTGMLYHIYTLQGAYVGQWKSENEAIALTKLDAYYLQMYATQFFWAQSLGFSYENRVRAEEVGLSSFIGFYQDSVYGVDASGNLKAVSIPQ